MKTTCFGIPDDGHHQIGRNM